MLQHSIIQLAMRPTVLFFSLATPAFATEAEHQLPEIIITGENQDGYGASSSATATKTNTPIIETPQSIHVIPPQVIQDQQNVILGETLKNVSSVVTNAEFSPPVFDATRIRGFAAEQWVDGFTQYYNPGDRESLINVQSLEVLKGSNAVLYGGGSGSPVGGVVNVVSKLPQPKPFGEFGIKLGTHGFAQPFFDVNQPMTEAALFRITGEYTATDSNVDVVEQARYNLNPSLTLTNHNGSTLSLQGKNSRWEQQDYQGLPATGTITGDFKIDEDLFIGNRNVPDSTSEFDGLWATLDQKINDIWSFHLKARYAESNFDEKTQLISSNVPDFFPPSTWSIMNTRLYQEQTEQSLLASVVAKFDAGMTKNTLLMGLDFSELEDTGFMHGDLGSAGAVDLTNPIFDLVYANPDPSSPFTLIFSDAIVENITYGAYVQLQSTVAERAHLLAGLRQAHVEVSYNEQSVGSNQKTDQDKLLPRLGAVFDLDNHFSIFTGYSEGLRGQPFAIFAPGSTPQPAESSNIEGGIKFDVDGHLVGQLALYQTERSNVAVGFPATPTGEQRARGFDADMTWQPNRTWKILANYAHTNAEFTDDASALVLAGNQLSGVPKNSARLWMNYSFQQQSLSGLSAGLGVYWQSEVFVDDANQFKVDGYHTFDTALNYQTRRYNFGLTVKNLTNEDYYQYYNYLGGRVQPDNGVSVYLTAAAKY